METLYLICKIILTIGLFIASFVMLFLCFKAKQIKQALKAVEDSCINLNAMSLTRSVVTPFAIGFMLQTGKKLPALDLLQKLFQISDTLSMFRELVPSSKNS